MASPQPLSQKAVARAAGVSASTVSRALSNHPGLPTETKKRIVEIANRLGYRKNALVSILTTQLRLGGLRKTEATLGYVTSLVEDKILDQNATYHQFYMGARDRAQELGYGLDVLWRREKSMTASRFTKVILARGIRGLILAPRPRALGHISLDWQKFAVSSIGHGLPSPHVSFSGAWHYALIHTALRKLRKYGYRRIGFCVDPESDSYARMAFSSRYSLFQQSLKPNERVPFPQDPFLKTAIEPLKILRWFSKHRPEAILCVGPKLSQCLERAGWSIPRDVGIADLCLPDESGERAGMFEMPRAIAATAVDLVVEQINHNVIGSPAHPKAVLFEGRWIDGKSLSMRR
jgi:LacI family transcriptional regulator